MGVVESVAGGKFAVTLEFSPHSRKQVERVAGIAKAVPDLNRKYETEGVVFAAIALTQDPCGNLTYDHLAALAVLKEKGLPDTVEVIPHVSGKDRNSDALEMLLTALIENGVTTVLALTGDKPSDARSVFELGSLELLQLIKRINASRLRRGRTPAELQEMPLLTAGAAVSPFMYTPGSLAMQYIKARKKIREGASFLVCQYGWDSERSEQLIRELADTGAPIFGNVLVLDTEAARHKQELPGCVVSEAIVNRLVHDRPADILARAGQQLAMFRQLGYAGAQLAKPGDFESVAEIETIVDTALSIQDWREHRDNITFPVHENPAPKVRVSACFSRRLHALAFERTGPLHDVAKACLTPFERSVDTDGALYRLFNCLEGFGKGILYHCQQCGDCFLAENEYVCTVGECEKSLDNPPCADADPRGFCGNNPNRVCVGETLYYRLLRYGKLDAFKKVTLPRRDPRLQNSASLLNYFFGRDHATRKNPLARSGLIQIAELIHASLPAAGAAMQILLNMGDDAFATPSRARLVLEDLIQTQAEQGASFIDLNIDALNAPDAPGFMRQIVQQVWRYGGGTPPCVDSSDLCVLQAGIEQWFDLGEGRAPLLNSIPYFERDKFEPILALRARRPFNIVCLLVGANGPLKSADEMYEAAREMFRITRAAGFTPTEVFFDTVTLGIASDGFLDAMGNLKPSHTRSSFHAIRKIAQDPDMKDTHRILGVSNWVYGATKRRVGHVRAFIAVAQRYGLDAVIADVAKQFGILAPAPELVDFVESYVALDGAEDSMLNYSATMQNARAMDWV